MGGFDIDIQILDLNDRPKSQDTLINMLYKQISFTLFNETEIKNHTQISHNILKTTI